MATLAISRSHVARSSQDVFNKSLPLISSGKLGDDEWNIREQFILAAIDLGHFDQADESLRYIGEKFPNSARLSILTGIRMEATESTDIVLEYYQRLLEADSANGAAWKRKIAVLRRTGKIEKTVEELCKFLDTFYSDVDGWVELCDIYMTCNQYNLALQALSHTLVLAPQNPFYHLQFAEVAYTSGDIPLAIKMFLVSIEMSEKDGWSPSASNGVGLRAWWGVKLCCRRLIDTSHVTSASNTPAPSNLHALDEVATEKILVTYSAGQRMKHPEIKKIITRWMAPGTSSS